MYPIHIIPYKGWTITIPCETILLNDQEAQIGRRMPGSADEYLDFSLGEDEPFLKDNWIERHELPNLSTSLLGTLFTPEDFKVIQKGEGDIRWDGTEIKFENFKEGVDYIWVNTPYILLGWYIFNLEGKELPYTQVFPKEKDYTSFTDSCSIADCESRIYWEEYKKLPANEQKMPFMNLKGSIKINHDPKNLNYWHFTIDIYPFMTKEPLEETKKAG